MSTITRIIMEAERASYLEEALRQIRRGRDQGMRALAARAPTAARVDAHHPDMRPPDTRPLDAHRPDARPPDTRPPDARPPDARPPDARPPDARSPGEGRPGSARDMDMARPMAVGVGRAHPTGRPIRSAKSQIVPEPDQIKSKRYFAGRFEPRG